MTILIINDNTEVIVDEDDYYYLLNFKWKLNNKGYVYRAGTKYDSCWNDPRHPGKVYMSRDLMGLERGDKLEVDHINGNILDNRKSNLRVVNRFQNMINKSARTITTSKYKGVYLFRTGKWHAQITVNKIRYHVGYFEKEEDAAKAYDEYAKKLHGEYAYLNFK